MENQKFPIHFVCKLYWIPGNKGITQFKNRILRLHSTFTREMGQFFDALVYIDQQKLLGDDHSCSAQLCFVYGLVTEDMDRLIVLARNSELLLLDGPYVKAICRNLEYVGDSAIYLGDEIVP